MRQAYDYWKDQPDRLFVCACDESENRGRAGGRERDERKERDRDPARPTPTPHPSSPSSPLNSSRSSSSARSGRSRPRHVVPRAESMVEGSNRRVLFAFLCFLFSQATLCARSGRSGGRRRRTDDDRCIVSFLRSRVAVPTVRGEERPMTRLSSVHTSR